MTYGGFSTLAETPGIAHLAHGPPQSIQPSPWFCFPSSHEGAGIVEVVDDVEVDDVEVDVTVVEVDDVAVVTVVGGKSSYTVGCR